MSKEFSQHMCEICGGTHPTSEHPAETEEGKAKMLTQEQRDNLTREGYKIVEESPDALFLESLQGDTRFGFPEEEILKMSIVVNSQKFREKKKKNPPENLDQALDYWAGAFRRAADSMANYISEYGSEPLSFFDYYASGRTRALLYSEKDQPHLLGGKILYVPFENMCEGRMSSREITTYNFPREHRKGFYELNIIRQETCGALMSRDDGEKFDERSNPNKFRNPDKVLPNFETFLKYFDKERGRKNRSGKRLNDGEAEVLYRRIREFNDNFFPGEFEKLVEAYEESASYLESLKHKKE